jgi:hypothetical protein
MSGPLVALTIAAAIGCGAMGGVFFASSAFVMAALRRLPAAQAVAAMQSINVTAVTPPFMLALFGTAVACVALPPHRVTRKRVRQSIVQRQSGEEARKLGRRRNAIAWRRVHRRPRTSAAGSWPTISQPLSLSHRG